MEITTQDFKRVAVMSVTGRVDSATAPELESQLRALVDGGKTHIVLDLKNVEYMSSAGLRAMVSTLKAVKRVNGDLRLANPSARVPLIRDRNKGSIRYGPGSAAHHQEVLRCARDTRAELGSLNLPHQSIRNR